MGKSLFKKKDTTNIVIANIDYDKLADAVYKANMRAAAELELKQKDNVETQKEDDANLTTGFIVVRFFKAVYRTLFKENKEVKFIGPWMSLIASIFLYLFGFISLFVDIWVFIKGLRYLFYVSWQGDALFNNLMFIAFGTIFILFLFLVSIFSFCSARELEIEKDKTFLASLLSGIVGLAALIIALLALANGVKP